MWYLYALIIWLLSLPLIEAIKKYISKCEILFGYIGIMLISGYFHLPLELTRVVVFYVFFLAGYLYKDALLKWIRRRKGCCLLSCNLLFGIFIIIGILAKNINANILWECLSYAEGEYTIWERLVFCVGAVLICLLLGHINMSYKNVLLIKLGKNTMPVYIFHAIFVKGIDRLEANIDMENNVICILVRFVIVMFIILFFQLEVIQSFLNKIWNIPMNRFEKKM